MPEDTEHINLRVPAELKRRAAEVAHADHRSLNSFILALLERAVREAERNIGRR